MVRYKIMASCFVNIVNINYYNNKFFMQYDKTKFATN